MGLDRRNLLRSLGATAGVTALAGCNSTSNGTDTGTTGDTVAFKHVGGEAHSVTAKGDAIPSDAEYWASGGFTQQSEAETGWENGKGAVASGQSYVHTFETTGTHEHVCIPHAAAGMEDAVVVESK